MLEKAPFLRLDEEVATRLLTTALREEVNKAGFDKVIVGLSGGIDSALSLYLCVKAFGAENVIAVRMPYKTSSPASLEDAQLAIDDTGVESLTIDITPQIDAYFERIPDATPLRRGNKMARERMSILYDLSAQYEALVIGTSNRTELLLGYGTQYGDSASAVNPLGDLYKTQVRQLAAYLGVPEPIITKPPSADLWEDQTDEDELGFNYLDVDRLLYYMIDRQYTLEQLLALQFDDAFIRQVSQRIIRNQYKRTMPVIIKLSERTVGIDFRYLRDWGS
ncbi:NAD+ synthase [Thermoactinomyces intermedius]|uniref:NH(3)-dependent NAD(+) synthetase n=2 Tax=Thermoactinomycetaceae TaxID=186824 RepID=A0A8I1DE27_THEIN|nr:NAD+ synthase [Thermoactinomyces intermedius]MBA4836703.1 NAD+ synthase [Thermoactinomyces intermedius]MBH8594507.1 NAD+ synthase [Thermoactinomyces intermedius]MBH8601589.1 NAD+ synthase [Thermoactinomyces sp. CICC 23799]